MGGTLNTEARKRERAAKSAPPPDPAAVEVLKAQAAARCAEQFKVCRAAAGEAGDYAQRARDASGSAAAAVARARASLGDAEVSASAEAEATEAAAAAEVARAASAAAAEKAAASENAAQVAAREAERVATLETLPSDAKVGPHERCLGRQSCRNVVCLAW